MKRPFVLLLLFLLLFASCDKEIIDELPVNPKDVVIQLYISYAKGNMLETQLPDSDSKVYIYYERFSMEFAGYSFNNGQLMKEGHLVSPDESFQVNENGELKLQLDRSRKFTIIIESQYYKKAVMNCFPAGREEIVFHVLFNP